VLVLWAIAPALVGGLQWSAEDLGVFFCVMRCAGVAMLLGIRHKPATAAAAAAAAAAATAAAAAAATTKTQKNKKTKELKTRSGRAGHNGDDAVVVAAATSAAAATEVDHGTIQRWLSIVAALLCVVLPFIPVAPASAADDDATSSFGPTPAPAPAPVPTPAVSPLEAVEAVAAAMSDFSATVNAAWWAVLVLVSGAVQTSMSALTN
jgi:hypothetical protein